MRNCQSCPIWMLLLVMLVSGCSGGPDPDREFGFYLNGKERKTGFGKPVAHIQELEAGYSYSNRFTIVWPLKKKYAGPVVRPGIIIEFEPERIEPGKETPFGTGPKRAAWMEYHPMRGHRVEEALLLVYSSRHGQGSGTIRFDVLEPRLGGRVKGTVILATLNGYYENAQSMEIIELKKPRKLEFFNWSFDLVLQRSIF
ncbi:MAG: hypothetical protein U9P14_12490 [Gemmatimonadota bacterium]|nr:hypothetical protein [Gemmatimonadota bacterium]